MKNFLSNWNFMRIIRLVLGIAVIIQGIVLAEWMFIVLGGFFSLMPLLNIGCCGATGCNTRPQKNSRNITEDIIYEEVK